MKFDSIFIEWDVDWFNKINEVDRIFVYFRINI